MEEEIVTAMRDRGRKSKEQEEDEYLRRVFPCLRSPGEADLDEDDGDEGEDAASDEWSTAQAKKKEADQFFEDGPDDNPDFDEDFGYHLCYLSAREQPRVARRFGEPCGPYRELTWLSGKPRIFAKPHHLNHADEEEARDLIRLLAYGGVDSIMRRNRAAVESALRRIRATESQILLIRLRGRRQRGATWRAISATPDIASPSSPIGWIASSCSVITVPIAKEIFKAAITEFLAEYRRIVAALVGDAGDSCSLLDKQKQK